MRCIKLFFVCIFILLCNSYSQDNPADISIKDSINRNELQFKNFFRDNSKKLLGKDDLLGPQLYKKIINDSLFVFNHNKLNLNDYSEKELAYFKESFQQLMELAKRNHYKYDLGEIGKYLEISRKILVIILAIISVTK